VAVQLADVPGPQQVIGRTYPDTGVEQGRAVLAVLLTDR